MKTTEKEDNLKPSFAQRMSNAMRLQQQRMADFISMRYEKLSQRNKKISLVIFGIVMSGASLYLITGSSNHTNTLSNATAKFPLAIQQQATEALITLQEYKQLTSFRHSLDSLREFNPMFYRHIIQERKGLLDSLDFLIKLYHKK